MRVTTDHPKLAWLSTFLQVLSEVLEGDLGRYEVSFALEDPLKALVRVHLRTPLRKSHNDFFRLAYAFARANDCQLHSVRREKRGILLTIFVKEAHGPRMNYNPLRGERYVRRRR
jgi:hypothetical protein